MNKHSSISFSGQLISTKSIVMYLYCGQEECKVNMIETVNGKVSQDIIAHILQLNSTHKQNGIL